MITGALNPTPWKDDKGRIRLAVQVDRPVSVPHIILSYRYKYYSDGGVLFRGSYYWQLYKTYRVDSLPHDKNERVRVLRTYADLVSIEMGSDYKMRGSWRHQ